MSSRAAVALMWLLALASFAKAQVYSAFEDFSVTVNPNGVWTYGTTATVGGTLTPFTNQQVFGAGQFEGWGSPGSFPFVMKNLTAGAFQSGTTYYPTGLLAMHPDNSGNFAVIRWVAPATGSYLVATTFMDVPNADPATVDVHVLRNSVTSLYSASMYTGVLSVNYTSSSLALTIGDTIDFVVGNGGNGYINDHTALAASITAIPEPAAAAWLAGAAVLLGAALHRRRARRPANS